MTIKYELPGKIDAVMLDLFRTELEHNIRILSDSLLALGDNPGDVKLLENMMRASHSIKGAARLVGIDVVVKLAHAMEDCFVAAQNSTILLDENSIDTALKCVDILKTIAQLTSAEHTGWTETNAPLVSALIHDLTNLKWGTSWQRLPKIPQPRPISMYRHNKWLQKKTRFHTQNLPITCFALLFGGGVHFILSLLA